MAFDFKQLRRGLTKYLDYDIKKNALDRELSRRTREKQQEAERKLQLENDEAQRKSLLDLAKLDTPAGIEAQSRLLPGLNRAKSEQFLKAKTFLSPLLREKQYGAASTLGVGEFGATEEDTAKIEAEKALTEARKEQANLARAKIGKVKMDIRKVQGDIRKQQDIIKKGANGNLKDLKETYNILSDEYELLMDRKKKISEDTSIQEIDKVELNNSIEEELSKAEFSRQLIMSMIKKYHFPGGEPGEIPKNVLPFIGPLTEDKKFQPTKRPKLDY